MVGWWGIRLIFGFHLACKSLVGPPTQPTGCWLVVVGVLTPTRSRYGASPAPLPQRLKKRKEPLRALLIESLISQMSKCTIPMCCKWLV
jgi:hypothetical protein